MVALAYSARTETTITLVHSATAGGAVTFQWQYATRPDFQFCVAPIIGAGNAVNGAYTATGFNRAQTYWIRAREVFAGNIVAGWSVPIAVTTSTGVDTAYTPGVQIQPALLVVPQKPTSWNSVGGIAAYPASNLGLATPAAAWRGDLALGAAVIYIETDGRPVDTVALLETNFPENTTWYLRGGDTPAKANGTAAADESSTLQFFRATPNLRGRRGYHAIMRLATPMTSRFIGIAPSFTVGPPGGIMHATHAIFGQSRVLKNYSDRTDTPLDLGTFERLRDGSPDSVAGHRMRKVDFTISAMTETQHETQFGDLGQLVGTNEPVFIVSNSKAGPYLHDRFLYGNLTQNRGSDQNMRFDRSLSIESIIN